MPGDELPECPAVPPVTSTDLPGLTPQVVLETKGATGERTFTCSGDVPNVYSEFSVEFTEPRANWFGGLAYDANGFPTYTIKWQDEYNDYKEYPRVIQTFKEFVEKPSPLPNTVSWARYKVLSDTGLVPFSYIERADTAGGAPPATCGGKATVKVPYTANYKFYACKEAPAPKPSPAAKLSPPAPASPAPVPEPVLSPPAAAAPEPTPAPATPVPASPEAAVPSPAPVPEPEPVPSPPSPAAPAASAATARGCAGVVAAAAVAAVLMAAL